MTQQNNEALRIDYDPDMDRFYIPINSRYEIQTKGKGSSFRICNTESHLRLLVTDEYIHPMLEDMAKATNAELNQLIAAKADSESILQGQQNTIAELRAENKQIDKINASLQAHINVLREALENIAKTNASTHGTTQMMLAHCIKSANEALASTPAQHINDDMRIFSKYSLQSHDDEVIERCAVAMENYHVLEGIPAMYIRALKGNQFPNSANLDMYNSVIFSDGSHGTMIMESKIVKWLCKNRAKDYFDEMVEGK